MATVAEKPLIFVSYSHRDEEAKDFVNRHLRVLQTAGVIDVWDDQRIIIGDDWYQKIETKLINCVVAVLLISTDFLSSEFCIKEEVSRLLERRKRGGMMIAPILLRPCAWEIFPWLTAIQMQPRDDTPLLELDELQQERELKQIVLAIHKFLKDKSDIVVSEDVAASGQSVLLAGKSQSTSQVLGALSVKSGSIYPPLPEGTIDLTHLPTSGYDVVGRDNELRMLDEVFDGNTLNIVSFRAWGGVGKSTLVNKWCEYLAADNYRGARRAFAWSFYSQGTNERITSADAFIDQALCFFGDGDPLAGSSWQKGERLAELIGKEKAILILDGMEPLQDAYQGIKDPALARLVECLAEKNVGLCVITTREPVKEFEDFPETTQEVNLEHPSKEAGRALFRIKGLRAKDDLLERTSEAFGNHALALDLLAGYLRHFASGDVKQALTIPDLLDVPVDAGRHPRRVIAAFVEKFGESPELDLLHILGLFDRPADSGSIRALRDEPAIPGLTQRLSALDESDWQDLLSKLCGLGLLAQVSHRAPEELDAHPQVREYFCARLRDEQQEAWKAGHDRLYEYLRSVPENHQPDTLAGMAPLFQGIFHGCLAERKQEALDELLKLRIMRHTAEIPRNYFLDQIGATGSFLGLIVSFFERHFEQPAVDLREEDCAWLLNLAAHTLRSLGRLCEAVAPLRKAISMRVSQGHWQGAARIASNLAEVLQDLGELAASLEVGKKAVKYSDKSGDKSMRVICRSVLANIWHQKGSMGRARKLFYDAEKIQAKFQPFYPQLYSVQGYNYHDFLLSLGQVRTVRDRALKVIEWRTPHDSHLEIALGNLSLGKALLKLEDQSEARTLLDRALERLREAGHVDFIAHSLLVRAAFFREVSTYDKSRRDLADAMRITIRCRLRLQECDAHLEYARLALAEGDLDDVSTRLKSAEALISSCGYHRRDPEMAELKEQLGHWS